MSDGLTTTDVDGSCPWCGVPHECLTSLQEEQRPTPGAWSVCIECGEIARFTHDLHLRKATAGEMFDLAAQSAENFNTLRRTQRAVKALKAEKAS